MLKTYTITKKISKHGKQAVIVIPSFLQEELKPKTIHLWNRFGNSFRHELIHLPLNLRTASSEGDNARQFQSHNI